MNSQRPTPTEPAPAAAPPAFSAACSTAGAAELCLTGDWLLGPDLPAADDLWASASALMGKGEPLTIEGRGIGQWDMGLVIVLCELEALAAAEERRITHRGLPERVLALVRLGRAIPERPGVRRTYGDRAGHRERVGHALIAWLHASSEFVGFVGQLVQGLARAAVGRAQFRRAEFLWHLQAAGIGALPIVTLISVLIGLILAFVGAVQLTLFGAQIYVADLVGIGMTREMGAMMTGIIMAGRTGAAYAAQLGTMQVNEEIDALGTFGLPTFEFLVLPRALALMLMMPLLCLYANALGMFGGWVVGVGMLDLTTPEYLAQTRAAVDLTDFSIGLVKSVVFGAVVALAGCWRGMRCGRSAQEVGTSATSAVVAALVWIVITDALITVICSVMGI